MRYILLPLLLTCLTVNAQDTIAPRHVSAKGFFIQADMNASRSSRQQQNLVKTNGFSHEEGIIFGYQFKGLRFGLGVKHFRLSIDDKRTFTDEQGAVISCDCKVIWSDNSIAPTFELAYGSQHKFPLYGVASVGISYSLLLNRTIKLRGDLPDYDEYFPIKLKRSQLENEPNYNNAIIQAGLGIGYRITPGFSLEAKAVHSHWLGLNYNHKYFMTGGQLAAIIAF